MQDPKKSKAVQMIELLVNSKLECELHQVYQNVLIELRRQRTNTLYLEEGMNEPAATPEDDAIDEEAIDEFFKEFAASVEEEEETDTKIPVGFGRVK